MKVFRAETGKRIRIRKDVDSLESLQVEIEQLTGVSTYSQILMTSHGLQLKAEMMKDIIQSSGKDEQVIFLFDRGFLDANNMSSLDSLNETVILEPSVSAFTVSSIPKMMQNNNSIPWSNINISDECGSFSSLFQSHHSQGQPPLILKYVRLYQEQVAQLMALNVAITNLDAHSRSVIEAHEIFNVYAQKEISKKLKLIQSLPSNLELLKRITVHPDIIKNAGIETNDNSPYTLFDYLPQDKYTSLANDGRETFDLLAQHVRDLDSKIRSIRSGTETIKKTKHDKEFAPLETNLNKIRKHFINLKQHAGKLEQDVTRVQTLISKIMESNSKFMTSNTNDDFKGLINMANYHTNEYLPNMQNIDIILREQVTYFVQNKNKMTKNLINNLQQISYLESSIANVPSILCQLEHQFRLKSQSFKRLDLVHQTLSAYARSIVEIVRRKEYSKVLLSKAQQLAEVMAHFRNLEQKRRDTYRSEVKKHNPVNIPALDDPPPMCDISTVNIGDEKLPPFTKKDIQELINLFDQIRTSSILQNSYNRSPTHSSTTTSRIRIQQSIDDPLTDVLIKLTGQLDGMDMEFEKILEKNSSIIVNFHRDGDNGLTRPSLMNDGRSLAPPQSITQPYVSHQMKRLARQSYSEGSSSSPVADVRNIDALLSEKTKKLESAEEKVKAYEARIKKLTILRSRYQNLETNYNLEIEQKNKNEKRINELKLLCKKLETSNSNLSQELKEQAENINTKKDTINIKMIELQTRHNELQIEHDLKAEKCKELQETVKELENKVNQEHSNIEINEIDNSATEQIEKLQNVIEDLKKNYQESKDENNRIIDDAETSISNWQDKYSEIARERNKLESQIEENIQKLNESEDCRSELEEKIKKLEEECNIGKESALAIEKQLKQEIEKIQKESEEEIQSHKDNIQNLTSDIEGWKASFNNLNDAREEIEKSDIRSREKIRGLDQQLADCKNDFQQVEKLIKNIIETILEYLPMVLARENKTIDDEKKNMEKNLNPVNMIRKLGDFIKTLDEELRSAKKSLEERRDVNTKRKQTMKIQTGLLNDLSKKLWSNYSNFKSIATKLELSVPSLLSEDKGNDNDDDVNVDEQPNSSNRNHNNQRYPMEEALRKLFENDGNNNKELLKDDINNLLEFVSKLDFTEFGSVIENKIKHAETLTERFKRESSSYKNKYYEQRRESKEKIAFRSFKEGDLAVFFPNSNDLANAQWQAFHLECPHYFIREAEINDSAKNKRCIIARIEEITEYISDSKNPEIPQYGLADGMKFYLLDVEVYQADSTPYASRRRSVSEAQTNKSSRNNGNIQLMSASVSSLSNTTTSVSRRSSASSSRKRVTITSMPISTNTNTSQSPQSS
ncbi:13340_t:CDS:10 [Entrophospora sp. SA101]|nr:13340_t:CDS:10 [Entrophospora sp. SA101]